MASRQPYVSPLRSGALRSQPSSLGSLGSLSTLSSRSSLGSRPLKALSASQPTAEAAEWRAKSLRSLGAPPPTAAQAPARAAAATETGAPPPAVAAAAAPPPAVATVAAASQRPRSAASTGTPAIEQPAAAVPAAASTTLALLREARKATAAAQPGHPPVSVLPQQHSRSAAPEQPGGAARLSTLLTTAPLRDRPPAAVSAVPILLRHAAPADAPRTTTATPGLSLRAPEQRQDTTTAGQTDCATAAAAQNISSAGLDTAKMNTRADDDTFSQELDTLRRQIGLDPAAPAARFTGDGPPPAPAAFAQEFDEELRKISDTLSAA